MRDLAQLHEDRVRRQQGHHPEQDEDRPGVQVMDDREGAQPVAPAHHPPDAEPIDRPQLGRVIAVGRVRVAVREAGLAHHAASAGRAGASRVRRIRTNRAAGAARRAIRPATAC